MSDAAPSVTPERITQFVWGFAPPLVIDAAVRHRVFDVLAEQKLRLDELAQATGASSRGLNAIVDVLVGFGLLARDAAERYALTPESEAFLVSHRPGFIGGMFRHVSAHLVPNWLHLAEIVGSGKPASTVNVGTERAPYFAEFVEGLFAMSYPSARVLAGALDLARASGPVSVLDLAAGSGVWGIALAQASPHVTVRAVDWPGVLPVTRQVAERLGLGDRLTTVGGDLLEAQFGSGHQIATLGQILHSLGVERSRATATHARGVGTRRHDRDRRILGGRGSARPNERADLRGEHVGQYRAWRHVRVRGDCRLADRGGVRQSASIASAKPITVDPCNARLTRSLFTPRRHGARSRPGVNRHLQRPFHTSTKSISCRPDRHRDPMPISIPCHFGIISCRFGITVPPILS
jgi:hypothetical protein